MTPQQLMLKHIRGKLSPAERLRQWAQDGYPPDGRLGRPRSYFGVSHAGWEGLMKNSPLKTPNLSEGLSWGMAFDGSEAWRVCVRAAYAQGYFWVCVQSGKRLTRKDPPYATFTFHCPVAQEDILRTVTALLPPEVKLSIDDFRWSSLKAPAELGMPWVTPRKYGWTGERLMAFFGLDERRNQIRVGSTAAPAQRCGNEELLLLGVSDLTKEQARAKLSPYRTEREGWFKATEKSLKLVAAMAAKYARKELSK